MTHQSSQKPDLKSVGIPRRKAILPSGEARVKTAFLSSERELPLLIQPTLVGVDLFAWSKNNQAEINAALLKYGGILFRGFNIKTAADFEQFSLSQAETLLEYTYRSTPRSTERGNIYTSTEYPADQSIPLHNENSYTSTWPMKIWFFCLTRASQGGETPIADSRRIFARIDAKIRDRFIEKKVMYVRNYIEGVDLSWQSVFQTTDKASVEEYCQHHGIAWEWRSNNHLRTRQICQAVAQHPRTGEMVWFNQAHLFHISSLPQMVREALLYECPEEDLPRNAYYGDGSPIETSILEEIRTLYNSEMSIFPWQEGDILVLDNMLTAHGRFPFVGSRKTLVAMAEPYQVEK